MLKIINSLVPKSKKKILFISRPDFSDNTKYLYDYMRKKAKGKQLSWLIYDKEAYRILFKNSEHHVFYLKSPRGVWEYVRSKIIITSSSSLWQIKSPLQKQFDLWHGIPLKGVLYMGEPLIKQKKQASNITFRFSTSNLSKALLSASLNYNAQQIIVTGHPRTDVLQLKTNNLLNLYNIDRSEYSKIIIYMPTWRSGYRNNTEGNPFDNENIFRLTEYNHKRFLNFLEDNNILLLLKLHPYEELLYSKLSDKNIKWITNKSLISHDIGIYDILGETDLLLTDYSSIYFDYLFLNKRIVFIPSDINKYQNNRGFILEPYELWTPGKKATTQADIEEYILEDDSPEEEEKRKKLFSILFKYKDYESSARIYRYIKNNFQ